VNQYQIRVVVASIVLFGHIGVFLIGFFILGALVEPFSKDTLQILLMSCPVLASTAIAGFKYVIDRETSLNKGKKVELAFAVYVVVIPILMIGVILSLFIMAYFRVAHFSIDSLKIALGVLETFFAAFLTSISDRLFGKHGPQSATRAAKQL
jgi:hypothetical protein